MTTDDGSDETNKPPQKKQTADAILRQQLIDDELTAILDQVQKEELEDEEMEPESKEAIIKAANEICYLKRYYDVMRDEMIIFPSVTQTILNYSLMEQAETHYFEEEDEFPLEYSAALRSIAALKSSEGDDNDDDDGHDDDLMDRLSMPLILTVEQEEEEEQKKQAAEAAMEEETKEEKKEETPTAETEETPQDNKENAVPHVLLLISKTTVGNREQQANQDLVVTMLASHGIEPVVLDGADPKNKERRNELFGISGIRAKYPQLFTVVNRETTKFIGDFDTIQMYNETGQLNKDFLLPSDNDDDNKDDTAAEPSAKEEETPTMEKEPFQPYLVLLISKLSTNPEQGRNQEMMKTMIETNGFTNCIEVLDGSDLINKDRRNQLFGISGLRAKYPQLFAVTSADDEKNPKFIGDFDTVQELNECGQLTTQAIFGISKEEKEEEPAAAAEAAEKEEPAALVPEKEDIMEQANENNKENAAPMVNTMDRDLPSLQESSQQDTTMKKEQEEEGPQLLLLISNISGNRQQDANQTMVLNNLKSNGLEPIMLLDGSDPQNKIRRNELFEISGLRAKYPQLFVVLNDDDDKTTTTTKFIGDFETIQDMKEAGTLTKAHLFGTAKAIAEKDRQQEQQRRQKKLLMIGAGISVIAAVLVAFVLKGTGETNNGGETFPFGTGGAGAGHD
eukprot:scaffold6614_cov88-Cylindrotheca_fusiformis.AAC.5